MHQAVPGIWQRVHWLASHSYPRNQHAKTNVPFEEASFGLRQFELDFGAVNRSLQILITETGWATHGDPQCTEQEKANWTARALSEVFFLDARIAGVMPFMLAHARFGDEVGWGYVRADLKATYPVFDLVRKLRLESFPDTEGV